MASDAAQMKFAPATGQVPQTCRERVHLRSAQEVAASNFLAPGGQADDELDRQSAPEEQSNQKFTARKAGKPGRDQLS